ncbi:DUF4179 domain-containing protein [Brevibacillus panacihumi]|uniref:DUF4179 domain-containing protein n=1 Tax=Brevibacillus panacihumi TaxID=497735 RepID=UPI003D02CE28
MTDLDREISVVLHRVAEREEIPDFVMPTTAAVSEVKVRQSKQVWHRWASMSIATAGAALLVVGVGSYASPDFAATVQSWMGQGEKTLGSEQAPPVSLQEEYPDSGIQNATRQGYTKGIGASTTDQGITINVLAIMADPTRVFVSYQIKKEDGSLIDPKELRKTLDKRIILTDDKNQQLTNGYGGGWDEKYNIGHLYFYPDEKQGSFPEQIKLLIDTQKIGEVKGHWELEVPFSLKEAIADTRVSPVESEYTTPQGLQIALRTVTEAPSSTVLELETKWDESAKKRLAQYSRDLTGKTQNPDYAPFVPYQQYKLEYRILDHNGKDVTAYQQENKRLVQGMLKEGRGSRDQYGHFLWSTAYVPFGESGPYTFVLDAVHMAEPVDLKFEFQPEMLSTEPKSFEYEGNRFTVQSLKKDKSQTPARTVLDLEVASRDIYSIEHVWWELTDQGGKSYPINGAAFDGIGKDSNGREVMRISLSVDEMEEFPKQLTLSLSALTKRYTDVEWSVELP